MSLVFTLSACSLYFPVSYLLPPLAVYHTWSLSSYLYEYIQHCFSFYNCTIFTLLQLCIWHSSCESLSASVSSFVLLPVHHVSMSWRKKETHLKEQQPWGNQLQNCNTERLSVVAQALSAGEFADLKREPASPVWKERNNFLSITIWVLEPTCVFSLFPPPPLSQPKRVFKGQTPSGKKWKK